MIGRRKFLTAGGTIVLLASAGCSSPEELKILGLAGAIPSRSLKEFEQKVGKTNYKTESQTNDLWMRLQNPENTADLVSLGDSWLDWAIASGKIQPFSPQMLDQIPNWQKLGRWQALGQREQVWGIPYRWGTTAIIYQQNKLKQPITSWADLWRPELERKLILPDDPAEVLGLVLKKLGHSYRGDDPQSIPDFVPSLQALHRQVLTYTSRDYLQPLVIDSAYAAVGWSVDLVRAVRQYPELKVVIPQEGTALWADLWVIPKSASVKPAALAWINSSLTPEFSAQIAALTDANSPIDSPLVPMSVRNDRLKFLDNQLLEKCEFIGNLPPALRQKQMEIWQKLRRSQDILLSREINREKNAMKISGMIKKSELGMSAWTLVSGDGTVYEIMQPVDGKLLKDGLKVEVMGKPRPDAVSINMVGTMLEVISFSILKDD
jgi:putative spermidine/putrescine transport system substrate-binding protein